MGEHMRVFYHGTIRPFVDIIVADKHFNTSNGEEHLLGKGIYLYEDQFQAQKWARMKAAYLNTDPVVLAVQAEINEEEVMDLDFRKDQDLFFKNRKLFLDAVEKHRFQVSYYTDSHFCDFLSSLFSVKILSKTFVYTNKHERQIPVRYTNQKQTDRGVTRHYRTERQFCIKDPDWVVDISEWVGDESE
jgi:hypothetical protein